MKNGVVFRALDVPVSQSLQVDSGRNRGSLQRRLERCKELAEIVGIGGGLIKDENRSGQLVRCQEGAPEQACDQHCTYAQKSHKKLFLPPLPKNGLQGAVNCLPKHLAPFSLFKVHRYIRIAPRVGHVSKGLLLACEGPRLTRRSLLPGASLTSSRERHCHHQ